MNVAIIPARGGSKRIPRKNIREFAGKPMLAYAIDAARGCNLFDDIVVSTDDDEIAGIASEYGVSVPFVRPVELADDYTSTVPVIAHAISACREMGWKIEKVCCIYPATPFLHGEDLAAALHLLERTAADYVFPVAAYPSAIQRALRRLPNGLMQPIYSQYSTTRTQDLEPAYFDAGQFYWGESETWLAEKIVHQHGAGMVIPAWRAIDIDTMEDWQRAELLYTAFNSIKLPE